MQISNLFDLTGKVAVVTGGGGSLGGAIARGLAAAGAKVAVTGRTTTRADKVAEAIAEAGGSARAYAMDVFEKATVAACAQAIAEDLGDVDILVNAAGGNRKEATTSPDQSFFDLPYESVRDVITLNLVGGVILPCQLFAKSMTQNPAGGSIVNISSMAAAQPLTRVVGYSAAKAAVDNFTKWLAVHMAKEYSPKMRVNAIAPGFFLTDQNRFLLTDEKTGELTGRGRTIIDHTPQGRFGEPDDLVGAALWLASDAARFTTGIVVPIDGGFSAFSGV